MLLFSLVFVTVACDQSDDDPTVAQASASPSETEASTSPSASPSIETSVEPSPSSATGDHPACEPAQRVSDLDDEVTATLTEELTKLVSASGTAGISDEQFNDFIAKVKAVVSEQVPELLQAYEDLAAAVPQNLAKHAEVLAKFTESFTQTLLELDAESIKNVDELLQTPEAFEAVGATFALDKFTQKECGIVLAD